MPKKPRHAQLLTAIIAAACTHLTFADSTWQSASGNWSDPANWSPHLPASDDRAYIINTDAINRGINLDITPTVLQLAMGNSGAGSTTLTQTGSANLNASWEMLGWGTNSQAVHTQTAANTSLGYLYLGYDYASTGVYNLSSSASLTVNFDEKIGFNGYGIVNQTAGTHISNRTIYFAIGPYSTGLYNLSDTGSLTVNGTESIGNGGSGTFNQTGGTHTINYTGLILGDDLFSPGTGAYLLSGSGILTLNTPEYIGKSGLGVFTQNGGTHTIGTSLLNQDLYLAYESTASGTYTLNDVTALLSVNGSAYVGGSDTTPGGNGILNVQNGTMNVINTLKIWDTSASAINLSGGLLRVGTLDTTGNPSRFLSGWTGGTLAITSLTPFLINAAGPLGSNVILSNSQTLSITNERLGETTTGTFTQNGGTHSVNSLDIASGTGASGTYYLNAGSLTVLSAENIGLSGTAFFDQTGGTHTIGKTLAIGRNADSTGIYLLSGSGILAAQGNESIAVSGSATFNQTGGTHTVGLPNGKTTLTLAEKTGSAATYILNGPSALLTVNGSLYIGGSSSSLGGTGIFNLQAGSMTVTNTLKTWNTSGSSLNISGGSLTVGVLVNIASSSSFSISGTGNLDLTTGDLILHSATPNLATDFSTLRSYLTNHQIASSSATPTTTLALMNSADFLTLHPNTKFAGQTLTQTDLLIKYTYFGDADLSGNITLNDYSLLEASFLFGNFNPLTNPASWINGDFNYDGKIDMIDFALIDNAFQNQSGTLASDLITSHAAQFGTPYLTALQSLTPIPEPASLSLLTLTAFSLLGRTRRSSISNSR